MVDVQQQQSQQWKSIGKTAVLLSCLTFYFHSQYTSVVIDLNKNSPAPDTSTDNQGVITMRNEVSGQETSTPPIVEWLKHPEVRFNPDFFSASWLVNKQTFLESNLEGVEHEADVCFAMFRPRKKRVRMPRDWFDFVVEHMSTMWDALDVAKDEYALQRTTSNLDKYRLERLEAADSYDRSVLRPTIALIAFRQYKRSGYAAESLRLTVSSLSAAVASLIQVGMGRIVVVGYEAGDEEVVREAFRMFSDNDTFDRTAAVVAHGTELAFARTTDDMTVTKSGAVNIPLASLKGLRLAMVGDNKEWTRTWVGEDTSQWKYVYLTEPDTMLHTRPSTLRSLEAALENGNILAPHRLQPIPYQGDFPDSKYDESLIPSNFKTPIVLNSFAGDVCCDERSRPGSHEVMGQCGNFWFLCGLASGNHSRLDYYDFMRLKQGTGVVNLAATEHGRRCIPQKQGRCERKTS